VRSDEHDYSACPDPQCERFPCKVFREGYEAGFGAGYGAGYDDGHGDGYAEGYSAGAADAG